MAFSYSALNNYGKVTLPSVDSWQNNNNILKDPPKSIMTRRINKVGETSAITSMIDDSGNRNCEAIQVYARGVNPMVSVSYSNYGNNGGQRSGGLKAGGQTQAKLPYTIIKDGAFRPPILLPQNLLPLSRMPRVFTTATTTPGFIDFSKKMRVCGTDKNTREVKSTTLKGCVRPTATYKMQTPLVEPFEVKYVIQPSIKVSATSGIRTMDRTTQHVLKPTKEIDQNNMHVFARSNRVDNRYVDDSQFDPVRYIQQTNPHAVQSNPGIARNTTSIDDILDLSDLPIQDIRTTNYQAPKSGTDQSKYIHEDIHLSRTVPNYQATTNVQRNIYKHTQPNNSVILERNTPLTSYAANPVSRGNTNVGSRDYRLAPKLQPGGFSNSGQMPMANQNNQLPNLENQKQRMNRLVMEQFENKFTG